MDYSTILKIILNVWALDFLRYLIPVSLAYILFWVILQKHLIHRFIQKFRPGRRQFWFEFKYSMSTVLIFTFIGVILTLSIQAGNFKLYTNIDAFGWSYFFLSIGLMMILHDAYFYWTHRLMHLPKIYKYVHKVHHKSISPSPWAAYSLHPIEAIIQAMIVPLILVLIPAHELAIFAFLVYMILRNVLGHLGYELFPHNFIKNKLFNWHTTTTHHSLHHEYFNNNYGLYFTWWDNWMKTTNTNYNDKFEEVTSRKPEKRDIKKGLVVVILLLSLNGYSQSPVGRWMTYDERTNRELSIIRIQKVEAQNLYEGIVDSILVAPHLIEDGTCIMCTDERKGKKIIGMEILSGYAFSDNEWTDGKILDPETGEIYSSKIWFSNEYEINVRGFTGPFDLFYRTQVWKKLNETEGIDGIWQVFDDRFNKPRALVELFVEEGILKGRVVRVFVLPHEGNYPICYACEGALKGRPIVGLTIMSGYKKSGNRWSNGKVLDPGNGTTYNSLFWLEDADTLVIRGYWGPFYRSQKWTRILE